MQLVDRPVMEPGHCIVNLSHEDTGGFVDTCLSVPTVDPRIYVSRQAVIDMGRLFGFMDPIEADVLSDALETATKRIDHLEGQLAEADRYAEAAEYTLKASFGNDTKIRNKPGRKPQGAKDGS